MTQPAIKPWLLVISQFTLLVVIIKLPSAAVSVHVSTIGNILKLFGMLVLLAAIYNLRHSLSILPRPTKTGQLVIKGMYKYVRHPMYFGLLTVTAGIVISGGISYKIPTWLLLVIVLHFKTTYEEQLLGQTYKNYDTYAEKTPKFLPKLQSYKTH